jgi:hypothetical protein
LLSQILAFAEIGTDEGRVANGLSFVPGFLSLPSGATWISIAATVWHNEGTAKQAMSLGRQMIGDRRVQNS